MPSYIGYTFQELLSIVFRAFLGVKIGGTTVQDVSNIWTKRIDEDLTRMEYPIMKGEM